MKSEQFVCSEQNALLFKKWLVERGGLAIWRSINLSNPGASWTAPLNDEQGVRKGPPNWQCASVPERIITDEDEVLVVEPVEVFRFRVAVRRGSNNPSLMKLTSASSAKLKAKLAKAGDESWHEFDYERQQAVVYKPGRMRALREVAMR